MLERRAAEGRHKVGQLQLLALEPTGGIGAPQTVSASVLLCAFSSVQFSSVQLSLQNSSEGHFFAARSGAKVRPVWAAWRRKCNLEQRKSGERGAASPRQTGSDWRGEERAERERVLRSGRRSLFGSNSAPFLPLSSAPFLFLFSTFSLARWLAQQASNKERLFVGGKVDPIDLARRKICNDALPVWLSVLAC